MKKSSRLIFVSMILISVGFVNFVSALPYIISPANNSVLANPTQIFKLDTGGTNILRWNLFIGRTVGNNDLGEYYIGVTGARNVTVNNIPIGGSNVYVRLWYETSSGIWSYVDYIYFTRYLSEKSNYTFKNPHGFFQKHSTWYERIPKNKCNSNLSHNCYRLDINSDEIIGFYETHGWKIVPVTSTGYGNPIYYADNTSLINIISPWSWLFISNDSENMRMADRWTNVIWPNRWDMIPIPEETKSSGMDKYCNGNDSDGSKYFDRELTIVKLLTNEMWDICSAAKCPVGTSKSTDGIWMSRIIKKWDLAGDGIYYPYTSTTNGSVCRAASVPVTHGVLKYDEVISNSINHALVFSTGFTSGGKHSYPAGDSSPYNGVQYSESALPIGGRIQLNPELNCSSEGHWGNLTDAEVALCKALQDYGAIHIDISEGGGSDTSFEMEDLDNIPNKSWNGMFPHFAKDWTYCLANRNKCLLWEDFKVIQPLEPDCNDGFDNDYDEKIDSDDSDCKIGYWEISDDPLYVNLYQTTTDINSDGFTDIEDVRICINVIINVENNQTFIDKCKAVVDDGVIDLNDIKEIVIEI